MVTYLSPILIMLFFFKLGKITNIDNESSHMEGKNTLSRDKTLVCLSVMLISYYFLVNYSGIKYKFGMRHTKKIDDFTSLVRDNPDGITYALIIFGGIPIIILFLMIFMLSVRR